MIFLIRSNSLPAARSRMRRSRLRQGQFRSTCRSVCLLESANLPLIVKFVVQGALHTLIHTGVQLSASNILVVCGRFNSVNRSGARSYLGDLAGSQAGRSVLVAREPCRWAVTRLCLLDDQRVFICGLMEVPRNSELGPARSPAFSHVTYPPKWGSIGLNLSCPRSAQKMGVSSVYR